MSGAVLARWLAASCSSRNRDSARAGGTKLRAKVAGSNSRPVIASPAAAEILGRQRHCAPFGGRRGSKVPFPIQRDVGNLISRYFDAIDLHGGLVCAGRENNHGTRPTGRNLHDARQVLVEAMHPQPVQVDTGRPGAKLAVLLDDTYNLQISYSVKIIDGVGKCADRARRHPLPP